MDKVIFGYIDSMSFTQRIQVSGEEESLNLPSESFAESLVTICNNKGIFKVHLFGNGRYIEGVTEQIERKEKELFSKNNIEIEVN